MVENLLSWARKQDIPVGPGRGSSAGSLVAWAIGITNIDPLRHGLLFERFINPERLDLPDADLDFSQAQRLVFLNILKSITAKNMWPAFLTSLIWVWRRHCVTLRESMACQRKIWRYQSS
jgi:hypothetical protein